MWLLKALPWFESTIFVNYVVVHFVVITSILSGNYIVNEPAGRNCNLGARSSNVCVMWVRVRVRTSVYLKTANYGQRVWWTIQSISIILCGDKWFLMVVFNYFFNLTHSDASSARLSSGVVLMSVNVQRLTKRRLCESGSSRQLSSPIFGQIECNWNHKCSRNENYGSPFGLNRRQQQQTPDSREIRPHSIGWTRKAIQLLNKSPRIKYL